MMSQEAEWKGMFAPSGSCLSLDQISDHLSGKGSDLARQKVAEHLQSCPRCSTELALYQDFQMVPPRENADVEWIAAKLHARSKEITHAAPILPAKAAAATNIGWLESWRMLFTGWRIPGMALATAALLLAFGIHLATRTAPEIPIPEVQHSSELRSDSVQVIAPIGDLNQVPGELRWKSYTGASRYQVRLFEVDGNLLWQGETSATVLKFPADVTAKLVPGKKLLWQVFALDASGRVMVSSSETALRLLLPQDPSAMGNR